MRLKIFISTFTILLSEYVFSQDNPVSYYLTFNTNLYAPISSDKRMYPIVGIDKDLKPSIFFGGFGVGVARWQQLKEKTSLKVNATLSNVVYWEPPLEFRETTNQPLGYAPAASTDIILGINGVYHYNLSSRFSVGAGVGVQTMLASLLFLPKPVPFDGMDKKYQGRNRYYKPFMPIVPLELSYRAKKILLNLRYEQALLKKYKHDMAEFKKDRFGVLFLELGIRLK